MKTMNLITRSLIRPFLILSMLIGTVGVATAQQLQQSNIAIYKPETINPGYVSFGDLSKVSYNFV